MVDSVYNVYKDGLAEADEDWPVGDYRALLLVGATTFDADHATVAAVLAANTEASDVSYARQALTSKTATQDNTNDRANLDAATVDFGALNNETPTAMVIFRQVTSDADSPPVSFHDTNFGTPANGAGYTVEFPNDVLRIT